MLVVAIGTATTKVARAKHVIRFLDMAELFPPDTPEWVGLREVVGSVLAAASAHGLMTMQVAEAG
jgi:hypothetical protein